MLTLVALCGLAQMIFGGGYAKELGLLDYFKQDAVSGKGGGLVGGALVLLLGSTVGTIGAYLILLVLFANGVVHYGEIPGGSWEKGKRACLQVCER